MTVTKNTPLDSVVEWVPEMRPVSTTLTGEMRLFLVHGKSAVVLHDGKPHTLARVAIRPKRG